MLEHFVVRKIKTLTSYDYKPTEMLISQFCDTRDSFFWKNILHISKVPYL